MAFLRDGLDPSRRCDGHWKESQICRNHHLRDSTRTEPQHQRWCDRNYGYRLRSHDKGHEAIAKKPTSSDQDAGRQSQSRPDKKPYKTRLSGRPNILN
jgi:hypothetical protein